MSAQQQTPHIFEQEYYQKLYQIEETHGWAKGIRDAMGVLLHKHLPAGRPLRVLDAGCGTGYLLTDLEKHFVLAHEPVGVDLAMEGLRFSHQRGASALLVGSVDQLPFQDAVFDLIICIDTIQHVFPEAAVKQTVEEFARLLSPDGLLYLRTNSALGHLPLSGVDADQYRRYRLEALVDLAACSGLQVVRSTYLNAIPGAWGFLREFLSFRSQKAAEIGPGLSIRQYPRWLSWLNQLMYLILSFENRVLSTGVDLPFGHSTAIVAQRSPSRG